MSEQDKAIISGNAKIDIEHEQILSLTKDLQNINLPKASRIASCERLLHYISEHIIDEEQMMKLYYVPDMKEHIDNHTELQEQFLKSLGLFIKTGGSTGLYIQDIFIKHITTYDVSMVEYIRKQKEIDANSIETGF